MLPVAEAEKCILEAVPLLPPEDCPLVNAHERVLRQPLVADRDLPPYDRVTMDGYALRHETWRSGTRRYRVVALQAAGARAVSLPAGDMCVEVMTGAVLPEGADTVVAYEDTTRNQRVMTVAGHVEVAAGQSVHRRGSDHVAGSLIVQPGVRLTGREIAVAAACGYAHLAVTIQPKIAVVATGDELVEVSTSVGPHQTRRSNDYALRAALIAAGQPRVDRYHLRDMRHEIEHTLWHIVAEYDVVLITGGVSKGKYDYLPKVLDDLGVKKRFQGVAQRPGKPFWFGLSPRHTPVFALPGNPAAAYICLHRYVLPALVRMSGQAPKLLRTAVLAEKTVFGPKLVCFMPVRLLLGSGGELRAAPIPLNTSGDFTGLIDTDGFMELPAEQDEFAAGTVIHVWEWV